jgi:SpoVK/Ycf46/Vps4 family AAA+-type ATPase
MNEINDLQALIRSRIPIILIETGEELRIVNLFEHLAQQLRKPVFQWTATTGLKSLSSPQFNMPEKMDINGLFFRMQNSQSPGIFLLLDFHPFLSDAINIRRIKDIALNHDRNLHTLVLISHHIQMPSELKLFYARFELSLPTREMLRQSCYDQAAKWRDENSGKNVKSSSKNLDKLIDNLLGLPLSDAERLIRTAIYNDGVIDDADLPEITQAKFRLLNSDSVLAFEYDTAKFENVGGLANLKEWLKLRKAIFLGRESPPGLDAPKGILLLGVQGCGKSLAAKAVAGSWGVPLLRLDFGSLYNKYYGETERNLREALKTAELMAPCVLWMDELEKGVNTGDGDDGASRRILATLLTWMAENKAHAFIVATANDISLLPPELMRKGRFDEIFFVDLPDPDTRKIILSIHLGKRGYDVNAFDLDRLTDLSEGFSGAELEQGIVSALYSGHANQHPLDTELIASTIRNTKPLSIIMEESIAALRTWASERTVPAN